MLGATMLTAALALVAQPAAGILADRIGRKPIFITGNLVCAVAIFGFFWSVSTASTAADLRQRHPVHDRATAGQPARSRA